MVTSTLPYLIIGQGLAGTILSHELLTRNIPHKVMDDNHSSCATQAAAGIINPITGRRYVKSWMIDELLPAALKRYQALENLLGIALVKKTRIIRTLDDQSQVNAWNDATSRPGYQNYVAEGDNAYTGWMQSRRDYGIITGALQVDVGQLIQHYQQYLAEHDMLVPKRFDQSAYVYEAATYEVHGITYDKLIFCNGYKAATHPHFSALPFQPAKGESLTIKVDDNLPEEILRAKIFVAPTGLNEFWTGGGYEWDQLEDGPTEYFKTKWLGDLTTLFKGDRRLSILSHKAGVRPSVKGRRPLLGVHPHYPRLALFNGMGTKGTSLAPYWSTRLIDHLEKGAALDPEVDLRRFLK